MSGPKVPKERRRGSAGESEIKKCLDYFSIPAKPETDIGIDFRCELLKNDKPTGKFFNVQAKATKDLDKRRGQSIKKTTLSYWLLQQPDPAYLIVYDEKSRSCCWTSIEDNRYLLLEKMFRKDCSSTTVYISIDKTHILHVGENTNQEFIDAVANDKYSVEQFWGRPQMRGQGYVKIMPPPPRSSHEVEQTRDNIRISLFALTRYYLEHQDAEKAYTCCEFLTRFDNGHYNHFELFGYISMALGDIPRAIHSFAEAINVFERDQNWPAEDKKNRIAHLKSLIHACRQPQQQKT